MSDSPGFPGARGVSPRCSWAAWRGCSISFASICRKPTADGTLTRRRVWASSAMAIETARLWVAQAASLAEAPLNSRAPEQLVAYVNLARLAVEAAALDLMQLVQRSVGLRAFLRPNPIERISRDLATYLRQPGPDRALTDAAAWILAQPVTRAGSVAVTVDEFLDAANGCRFGRCVRRSRIGRSSLSRPIPTMRAWAAAA